MKIFAMSSLASSFRRDKSSTVDKVRCTLYVENEIIARSHDLIANGSKAILHISF